MPRTLRQRSATDFYHVMIRGINRETLFHDYRDYYKILYLIQDKNQEMIQIYAYCIMSNHVHLLVRAKLHQLSTFMRKLDTTYAMYYNYRYGRVGHVFQNRFLSEAVENEAYFWSVVRYIHNNPVKAGIVAKPQNYKWSSMKLYRTGKDPILSKEIQSMVNQNFKTDTEWLNYHRSMPFHIYLDTVEDSWVIKKKLCTQEIDRLISEYFLHKITDLKEYPEVLASFIYKLQNELHMTYGEIEAVTGITKYYIRKYLK